MNVIMLTHTTRLFSLTVETISVLEATAKALVMQFGQLLVKQVTNETLSY